MTHNLWLLSLTCLWIIPFPVSAAPITFNSALPVAKGALISREQVIIRRFKEGHGSEDSKREVNEVVSVLGYGITPKIALFAALPYLDKSVSQSMGQSRVTRSADGFGDLKVFGRFTMFKKDMRNKTFRVAAFGGFKAPTGQITKNDISGKLPISLQPGTGSWDTFGGIVSTYQTLPFQIDGQLSYRHNGSANNFQAGDEFRADLSVQYRLLPQTLSDYKGYFLYGVVETSLTTRGHNKLSAIQDINSGGTTIFITPGLQYVTRKWIFEAAVQLPLIQNLNGSALRTDYIFSTGFRVNF